MKSINSLLILFFLYQSTFSAKCPLGCSACTDMTTCTACESGFTHVAQGTKCLKCPPNCEDCDYVSGEGFTCNQCAADFELSSDGVCFKCDPMCETCSNLPTNCTSCRGSLILQEVGLESICVNDPSCQADNCKKCSNVSENVCERCQFGFFNFQGNCIGCGFPCGECEYRVDEVYFGQVVPFIERLRNASNTTRRRLQGQKPPIDIMNDDLYAMPHDDREDVILGKILYDIIREETDFDEHESTLIAQEMVNKQRETAYATLQERILIMAAQFTLMTQRIMDPYYLEQRLHIGFLEDTTCHGCHIGFKYKADTEQCLKCPEGCKQCDMSQCFACKKGFSLKGDSSGCERCQFPCRTCGSGDKTSCQSCEPPFKLTDDNNCVQCTEPCLTCNTSSTDSCETCKNPYSYFADGNKQCFRCPDFSCRACDPNNKTNCYECREGTNLVDGKCEGCPQFCTDCDLSGNSPVCYECEEGHALVNNECKECGKGCLECSLNDQDICIRCFDGLFVNGEGECKKCSDDCETCENQQECIEYKKGVVNFKGKTVPCRKGCSECDPQDPRVCIICDDGFYLHPAKNKCKRCGKGCKLCDDNGNCIRERRGWVLLTDGSHEVRKCEGKCLTCDEIDISVCTSCRKRFNLENDQCVRKCRAKCLDCDPNDFTKCFKCAEGYTARENGKCDKCLGSCSGYCDPKNIKKCLSCAEGFQLRDNQCIRCPEGCSSCYGGHCVDCFEGFRFDVVNDKVVCVQKCKEPCEECRGRVCTSCIEGFRVQSGRCVANVSCNPDCDYCQIGTYRESDVSNVCIKCKDNCATCTEDFCEECFDGYYSENGDCLNCSGNCEVCTDEETCQICKEGYVREIITEGDGEKVYSGECIPCDNCATCSQQADICLSCDDDHKLNGTKCVSRMVVGFQFKLNVDYYEFLEKSGMMTFVENVAEILGVDMDLIIINDVSEGSTDVDGVISVTDEDEANSNVDTLENNLDGLGYDVLSSSINVYYDDEVYNPATEEELPLGIIIGCSVGGAVLIGIIIFIVYKVKSKNQVLPEESMRQQRKKEWSMNELAVEDM